MLNGFLVMAVSCYLTSAIDLVLRALEHSFASDSGAFMGMFMIMMFWQLLPFLKSLKETAKMVTFLCQLAGMQLSRTVFNVDF